MFGGFGNRAAAYAKVSVETGVNTADPHKLILMLFDGALLQVRTAGIGCRTRTFLPKAWRSPRRSRSSSTDSRSAST